MIKSCTEKLRKGIQKVGQSIDLHGKEDNLTVREAATYWNGQTTDGYHTMRQNINAEIPEVAEHVAGTHIAWTKYYVRRLICKYPPRPKVDRVLNNLGDDFAHDAIHDLSDAEEDEADKLEAVACDSEDETAVAADDEDEFAAASGDDDVAAGSEGDTAVAAVCDGSATDAADDKTCEEIAVLSVKQAGAVHQNKVQIAALQGAIEAISLTGQLKVAQHMEREIATLKRRQRALSSETPVVADAFKRQRLAEEQEFRDMKLRLKQAQELRKHAQTAVAAKHTALAGYAKAKRATQDLDTKHA